MSQVETQVEERQGEEDMTAALAPQSQSGSQSDYLPCPECEAAGTPRSFKNAQGLARHRSVQHNVAGASRRTTQRRGSNNGRGRGKRRTPAGTPVEATLNSGQLARIIAPSGMVPVYMIDAVTSWIAEGERIYAELNSAQPEPGRRARRA